MAQQQINYGAFPDDANADAIRTAFLKVDQNFTDLYNNGVAGVTSVNSGPGVIARRSGSNISLYANLYQLNLVSGANSLQFSIALGAASNVGVYTQGTDPLRIDVNPNLSISNLNVSSGIFVGGTQAISYSNSNVVFTGDGSGLQNIPLRPVAGGAVNQIQFVTTDTSGNLIVVGNSNFNYVASSNTLTVTGVLPVSISGSNGGISAAGDILAANVSVNNNTITNNLVVNNSATFSGTVNFANAISSNGQSVVANTTQSTSTNSGALVVSGGAGIAGNINVGGNAQIAGNTTIGGGLTVTNTISGGNLTTTGNITASGNSAISGNSVVGGTLTVGNTVTIAGQTTINNNISVTGNSTVTGNSSIGGNASITGNITVSGTSNVVGNATFGGEIIITPTVAQTNQVLFVNGSSAIDGNNRFTWNQAIGVLTLNGSDYTTANTAVLQIAGGAELSGNLYVGGQMFVANLNANNLTSNSLAVNGNVSVTGNIPARGLDTQIQYNNTGNTAGATGFTYNSTTGGVTVANTFTGGNLVTGGNASVTGNVTIGGNTRINGQQLYLNSAIANAAYFTGQANVANIIARNLTATRIVFVDTDSELIDDANFTWSGTQLTILGSSSTSGNVTIQGNLAVDSNARITGETSITSGNLTVGSGNVSINGGDLYVNGNTVSDGNLSINGTGNSFVAGNLGVAQQITAGANIVSAANIIAIESLYAGGNIFTSGNVNANNLSISNLASITGAVTLGNTLSVANSVTFSNNFTLVGNATLSSNVSIGINLTVTGNTTFTGNATAKGSDTQVQYNDTGNIAGASSLVYTKANGYVQMTANAQVGGNLAVVDNQTIGGNIIITGNANVTANVNVTNNVNANNANITNTVTLANITAQGAEIAVRSTANLYQNLYVQGTSNIRGAAQFGSTITMEGTNALTTRTITTGGAGTTGTITGNWTLSGRWEATYADLAENYSSDQPYLPGTVLEFGGEREVTLAAPETTKLAGVVTTEPAYVMNSTLSADHPVTIALVGRVPVRVTGYIHKGDMLISAGNGVAKACAQPLLGQVIGKSLEDYASHSDQAEGIITVAISRH